ncbi:hypothetical protein FB561_4021 [Kribbella amoyensis]|uniref:WD40 repeat protein n=1 Tax=Kribbella amoyensis TaxID=996641 RepID=A0A561BVE3_9ACTN|nr:hypothetical protein [Kribbella amoyensis]TWD82875.1 hypothetical protein FB561_4021 [Kribbella amoyensis]
MTDSETRLRDLLQAEAGRIPEDAELPSLDLDRPGRRRTWPALAAAAAVVAMIALAVPLVIHWTRSDERPPTDEPVPGLGVPYLVVDKQQTLHDGARTVQLPAGAWTVDQRVAAGWLVGTVKQQDSHRAGVLHPDGTVTLVGPLGPRSVAVSPDRTRMATSVSDDRGRARIVVVDLSSGKEIAAKTVPHQTVDLLAWNINGLWWQPAYTSTAQPSVWDPRTDRVTTLDVPGYALGLAAPGSTDRVLLTTGYGGKACFVAGRLVQGKLTVDREYCRAETPRHDDPVLSPDGRTIVDIDERHAVSVDSGKVTQLAVEGIVRPLAQPVFEDANHLLVVKQLDRSRQSVYRCDVRTGGCEVAYTSPPVRAFRLIQP